MRRNVWLALLLVMIVPSMLFTVSCAKKQVETAPAEVAPPEDTGAQEAEAARMAEEARMRAERERSEAEAEARDAFVSVDIYFDFDSSVITPDAQTVLRTKAAFMRDYPDTAVEIEGHCDERGTEAYNMALGERRAEAAKSFLVNLGIDAGKISTISYGEERPVDPGHNEAAWSKNRRAHFAAR